MILKNSEFIIAVDIDGVLRDLVSKINEVYKREYPSHKIKNITEWDLSKFFPIGDGIHYFVFEEHAKEIFTYAKPYNEALEFCKALKCYTNNLILCSTQNPKCQIYTLEWLDQNKFEYDTIVFTSQKNIVRSSILLDDNIHNLEIIEKMKPLNGTIPICFNQPWNQKWKGKRIFSYEDFMRTLRQDRDKT